MLAILTITFDHRNLFPARAPFYRRVEKKIISLKGKKESKALLFGLE